MLAIILLTTNIPNTTFLNGNEVNLVPYTRLHILFLDSLSSLYIFFFGGNATDLVYILRRSSLYYVFVCFEWMDTIQGGQNSNTKIVLSWRREVLHTFWRYYKNPKNRRYEFLCKIWRIYQMIGDSDKKQSMKCVIPKCRWHLPKSISNEMKAKFNQSLHF